MDLSVSLSNQALLEFNRRRKADFLKDPEFIYPWWRPCHVRTLLVTDGALDFGDGDFGLSTFVHVLQNDRPFYARFDITLAHLRSDVTDAQVMQGAPGIVRSIKGFRFDVDDHFTAETYDEVWLFGFETVFHSGSYAQRHADHARYPSDRLGDEELRRLSAHMNGGRGVFATGDHGALGRGLCGSVNRVRSMRYWAAYTGPTNEDEVSMTGARRNDSNQIGHDVGSQFSDQSDDIPQTLDLVLYTAPSAALRVARYPHPVLCGRLGRLDILPDHPHEGECRVPGDLTKTFDLDGSTEYPAATDGSGQVVPEVIATSRVPAGNTASETKTPTQAHNFGAISAYDGHRAAVGRVICDATWHHFVNVNLIGVIEGGIFDEFDRPGEDATKHDGFLSSPAGLAALNRIKNYYTNIGIWIAPPARHRCFNWRVWPQLLYKDRLMEAALVDPAVKFDRIPLEVFLHIGIHARDVIGRLASQCQTIEWLIDWIRDLWPEVAIWVNPWDPIIREKPPVEAPLPLFDPMPLIDVALGGALVAMRQAYPYPPEKLTDEFDKVAREAAAGGARRALELGVRNAASGLKEFNRLVEAAAKRSR
jgi:hypothetical protein